MTAIEDARAAAQDWRANVGKSGYSGRGDRMAEAIERLTTPPTVEHHYPDGSYDVDWTATPTDDEREALAKILYEHEWVYDHDKEYEVCACGAEPRTMGEHQADAILAAGFRRQGPITDEWEYGVEVIGGTGETGVVGMTWSAPLANPTSFFPSFIRHVRRRAAVPAGAWEPVEAARDA